MSTLHLSKHDFLQNKQLWKNKFWNSYNYSSNLKDMV